MAAKTQERYDMASAYTTANLEEIKTFFTKCERNQKKVNILLDGDGNTLLHNAVKRENYIKGKGFVLWDVAVVKYLIEQGAYVNVSDKSGMTPLNYAAMEGNVEAVKILLSVDGIDVNAGEKMGYTPLHRAASSGHVDVIKALISHKDIDVNKPNNTGWTPLHLAAMMNKIDVCKVLLSVGRIEVNTESRDKLNSGDIFIDTPLLSAIGANNVELANLLISNNADVNVVVGKKTLEGGVTPLEMAKQKGIL
jgi:ankyrin repeat protein